MKGLMLFAMVVLAGAAVWLGGLNHDEGWYLYAANLVGEGQMPYRDFFYTQGPLMPIFYSPFAFIWRNCGLLGARIFTALIGLVAIGIFALLARRLAPREGGSRAALVLMFLLGNNLYHLYYTAIPKTYALASLFVALGFWLLSFRNWLVVLGGLSLAFAAGTRISLGVLLCVVGVWLLWKHEWKQLAWFCLGGFAGLGLVYGPFLLDVSARSGLFAAQAYHAARGGFDPVFTIGSLSRLVRWYLPVFLVAGLGVAGVRWRAAETERKGMSGCVLLAGFIAVFAVQMLAPFPYEDYQVPVMGLLAVFAAVNFPQLAPPMANFRSPTPSLLLILGLCWAVAFGNPLLERWMTNGQDRFWSLKKGQCELAQLQETAERIELLDPQGSELLTQDLYLAIEANRKVPKGLEMGPFSMLSDAQWRELLTGVEVPIAALSGYTFAIDPPVCTERPIEKQIEYWNLLKQRYELVDRVENFGQNATPLLLLRNKAKSEK